MRKRARKSGVATHASKIHSSHDRKFENAYDDDDDVMPSLRKLTNTCPHHKKQYMCAADVMSLSQFIILKWSHLQTDRFVDSTRRGVSIPYQQLIWHAFPNLSFYATAFNTSKKLGPICLKNSRTIPRLLIVVDALSTTTQASRSSMAQLRL